MNHSNGNRAGKPGTHIHMLLLLAREKRTASCSNSVVTCYGASVMEMPLICSNCIWQIRVSCPLSGRQHVRKFLIKFIWICFTLWKQWKMPWLPLASMQLPHKWVSLSEAFFKFLNAGGFDTRLFHFLNSDHYSWRVVFCFFSWG